MLSKEEIEKAKEKLKEISIETELDFVYKNIEIILEYIEQLEQEKADRTSADNYENSYIAKLESDKQKLIEKLEKKIRYYEENDEILATSNDNYSDGTVIKKFIDEFREILSILKGE